jgi:hypothetical protein
MHESDHNKHYFTSGLPYTVYQSADWRVELITFFFRENSVKRIIGCLQYIYGAYD